MPKPHPPVISEGEHGKEPWTEGLVRTAINIFPLRGPKFKLTTTIL